MKLSPDTQKVISDFQGQRELVLEMQRELDNLGANHKRIQKDLAALNERLAASEAAMAQARGDYLRGRTTPDELAQAREAHAKLEAAVAEANSMSDTAQQLAQPAMRQMDERNRLMTRFSKSAWDALANEEAKEYNLSVNMLRGYAAAKRGTFPPTTLGAWIDSTLGDIDVENHSFELAVEHDL